MSAASLEIVSLIGVYNADGTLSGELRYWFGARLGRTHCALCEITHGTFLEKDEWKRISRALPVPFDAVHLDQRSPEVRAASGTATPCVIARLAAASKCWSGLSSWRPAERSHKLWPSRSSLRRKPAGFGSRRSAESARLRHSPVSSTVPVRGALASTTGRS